MPPKTNEKVLRSKAKVFANVNENMPESYWDYENYQLTWGNQDRYEIIKKIGRGKYSDVFDGWDTEKEEKVVIKVLKPVKKKKIKREIKILENVRGGPNIIGLVDVVRDSQSRVPALIFDTMDTVSYRELWPVLTDVDMRHYLFQLLRALNYCHSKGIMHRDVKPHNLIINPAKRQLKLLDFGLAEFYHPNLQYNVRVASRFFKPPELLVYPQQAYYDYSLDLWSFGCVMAGLIFSKEPFFRGKSNPDQLLKIVRVLGTDAFNEYLDKYSITLDFSIRRIIGIHQRVPWNSFINTENEHVVTPEAIDLLDQLLRFDQQDRPTAQEAMDHCYFDSVRNEYV
eukprot:TRINITY_DN3163_c0_g3_i1.p1 TRINITY_DN3163_c0_g3~~TRINITY_DN3163_c0_g3_i1.p1  ORF type:complete len:340 (-),score=74.76 TRINITY_DN3163_c0_g3_i1:10-1029(-)